MTLPRKTARAIDRTKSTSAALHVAIATAIQTGETLTITERGVPRARVVVIGKAESSLLEDRARAIAAKFAAERLCTVEALFGPGRNKRTSHARQDLWRELRDHGWSYEEIGRVFDRDHTTIIMGVRASFSRATEQGKG